MLYKLTSTRYTNITLEIILYLDTGSNDVQNSGTIEHRDYGNSENEIWHVNPSCEEVRVVSTHLSTEYRYDFVNVDGTGYSGHASVDQIVRGSFQIKFTSDVSDTGRSFGAETGFTLTWQCLGKTLIISQHCAHQTSRIKQFVL